MNVSDIFLMLLGVNPGPQPGFCCCNTLSGMQVTINVWCLMLSIITFLYLSVATAILEGSSW